MFARQFARPTSSFVTLAARRTLAARYGSSFVKYNWQDPLNLDKLLTDEERMVRDAAHDYCQGQLQPRVLEAYRNESKS